MTRQTLTPCQMAVLDTISDFIKLNGYSPTVRELQALMGLKSTNGIFKHLLTLKQKGYITEQRYKSRTITIIN